MISSTPRRHHGIGLALLAAWGGLGGPLAVAGACLAWAVDNNLTQKVSGGDPVQIAMVKGLVAGAINTSIALALGSSIPSGTILSAALVLGFLTERHEHEHVHEPLEHDHAHVHDEHHRHAHGAADPAVTDPTPHSHVHRHDALAHSHAHYPDLHHRHGHA